MRIVAGLVAGALVIFFSGFIVGAMIDVEIVEADWVEPPECTPPEISLP